MISIRLTLTGNILVSKKEEKKTKYLLDVMNTGYMYTVLLLNFNLIYLGSATQIDI